MTGQNKNTYISVAKNATAEITEKKSTFICNIGHVETESDAAAFIDKVKKQHYSAKHNVYAFLLADGYKKYTDDGEPSKTAGLPILDILEKSKITDTVCVVTRYFGGVLLGTGGLVRAYSAAAQAGIEAAGIVEMVRCNIYEAVLPYSQLSTAEYILKKYSALIENKTYAENITLTAALRFDVSDALEKEFGDTFGAAVKLNRKGTEYRKL